MFLEKKFFFSNTSYLANEKISRIWTDSQAKGGEKKSLGQKVFVWLATVWSRHSHTQTHSGKALPLTLHAALAGTGARAWPFQPTLVNRTCLARGPVRDGVVSLHKAINKHSHQTGLSLFLLRDKASRLACLALAVFTIKENISVFLFLTTKKTDGRHIFGNTPTQQ